MAKYNITLTVELVDKDRDIWDLCDVEDEITAMLKEIEKSKRYSHTFENFIVKQIKKNRS